MDYQQSANTGTYSSKISKTVRALSIITALLFCYLPAFSQGNAGRILGVVTDKSGGAIANATVTVVDTQRGLTRTLTADSAGAYDAPSLLPGTYTVRAGANGFKTAEHSGILLEVGKELRVDLTLEPGDQVEKITVTGEMPIVETTNATLGGTLSNETINDLPLNGRNYQNLLSLRPAVTVFPGGGLNTQSTNGIRPEDNMYLIDNLSDNEPYTGLSTVNEATLAGDVTTILPIDAIQEFNTQENPKAEYGWKPGAVVNVGLKSGTNSIHGTAYAFGRSDAFDARNYFNTVPASKAPVNVEQFGATAGGPIKKDKLFWFGGFEEQRYLVGSTFSTNVPVTAAIPSAGGVGAGLCNMLVAGDCHQSLVDACNDLGRIRVSPLSAQIAGLPTGSCIPNPTNTTPGPTESLFPTNNGPSTTIVPGIISNNRTDNWLGKIDYHLNDRHSLNGMFFFGQDNGNFNDAPDEVLPIWNTLLHVRSVVGQGGWTWIPNSTHINEFRAGYSHFYQSFLSADHNIDPKSFGVNTGVTNPLYFGFPIIQIQPFPLPQFRMGAMWPRILGPDGVFQVLDHVSILRGKHAFKFGGEFIRTDFTGNISSNSKGFIKFASLEDFLSGIPAGMGSKILTGNPERHLHNQQYAAFFQDDWRVTQKLTLNLGLRYELFSVIQESNNLLANFDPQNGMVQVGHGINSAYDGSHHNFAPRFGLAWDVQGNAKNVVRAGVGVVYEQLPYAVFVAPGNGNGLFTLPTGATITTCPASCMLSGTPVTTPGSGTIAVTAVNVAGGPGSPLAQNWQNNSSTVALFPSTSVQCGDGLTPPTTPGNPTPTPDPGPCNIASVDRKLRNPYVTTWTLGIEHSFTDKMSLEIAYVGTQGSKLIGITDINQPTLGSGYTSANALSCLDPTANPPGVLGDPSCADASAEQAARPFNPKFPYLGYINRISNLDSSSYNGLQVTFTQRPIHGLSFEAGYTYSHALDDVSSTYQALIPPDSSNPKSQWASTDFDIRHRFTLSTTYTLPGKEGYAQLLKGWQLNSIVTLQTGAPWGPMDMSNDFSGTGDVNNNPTYGQRWNFSGNPNDFTAGREAFSCWSGSGGAALAGCTAATQPAACLSAASAMGQGAVDTLNAVGCIFRGNSVLIPPAIGTFGTVGRNVFRDMGFRDWDLSMTKNFLFRERLTAQFRAEFFNILNHPSFANPWGPYQFGFNDPSGGFSGGFGCACATPDVAASNPVLGSGSNRSIQLGLKLIF